MAKCFITAAESIKYHPKVNGQKDMTKWVNAIQLHILQKSIKVKGLLTDKIFITEDMELYNFIFENLGESCSDIANWLVNIERDAGGYICDFQAIKHYDGFNVVEALGLNTKVN